jgi:hypothetical protein
MGYRDAVARRKQVYKITYPNGKIYVGMDLTGTLTYFGSPSAHEQIAADHDLHPQRFDFTLRKEILWESETSGGVGPVEAIKQPGQVFWSDAVAGIGDGDHKSVIAVERRHADLAAGAGVA